MMRMYLKSIMIRVFICIYSSYRSLPFAWFVSTVKLLTYLNIGPSNKSFIQRYAQELGISSFLRCSTMGTYEHRFPTLCDVSDAPIAKEFSAHCTPKQNIIIIINIYIELKKKKYIYISTLLPHQLLKESCPKPSSQICAVRPPQACTPPLVVFHFQLPPGSTKSLWVKDTKTKGGRVVDGERGW